jgi:hypothetical protein
MFILPLDSPIALLLASICLAFEFLRIVIAFLIAKPSSEIGALNKQKVIDFELKQNRIFR